jgi:hypothetical protein
MRHKHRVKIGGNVFKRSKLNRKATLNLGGIVCLIAGVYCIYYLLILDKILPFSISSVLSWSSHYAKEWHILTVGLVPIYLALMIFGTSMLSLCFGSALQRWLTQLGKNKI